MAKPFIPSNYCCPDCGSSVRYDGMYYYCNDDRCIDCDWYGSDPDED